MEPNISFTVFFFSHLRSFVPLWVDIVVPLSLRHQEVVLKGRKSVFVDPSVLLDVRWRLLNYKNV